MKKILILTLGGGSRAKFVNDEIRGTVNREERRALVAKRLGEQADYAYSPIKYRFADGDCQEIETPFVSEALIRRETPDYVFILGTVMSYWLDFYRKYSDVETEQKIIDICDLVELFELGKTVEKLPTEPLRKISARVERIFSRSMKSTLFSECPQDIVVKPVLLRNGVNDEQLRENYEILSDVWQGLDKNESYDVSFDITYSFRSLPIYNLSLLDYQRQIANFKISISHVYYGNYEDQENGYAPIIDIADLVKVMDLSRGVSEFRELGYSMTLINQIPETMPSLRNSLEEFYWAVQMNDVTTICDSTRTILSLLDGADGIGGRFADLRTMIHGALSEILGGEPENYSTIEKPSQVWMLKLLLAKWHGKKNRFADALSSALESLRVYFNYCFQTHYVNMSPEHRYTKAVYSFNNLQSAEEKALERCRNAEENSIFVGFVGVYEKAKDIRNTVAHFALEEKEKVVSADEAREYANRLIDFAEKLYCDESFAKAFDDLFPSRTANRLVEPSGQENNPVDPVKISEKSRNGRNNQRYAEKKLAVYIGPENATAEVVQVLKKDCGEHYQLYRLDSELYDTLFSVGAKQMKNWAKKIAVLNAYLADKISAFGKATMQNTPFYICLPSNLSFFVAMALAYEGEARRVFFTGEDRQYVKIPGYVKDDSWYNELGIKFMFQRKIKGDAATKAQSYMEYELIPVE